MPIASVERPAEVTGPDAAELLIREAREESRRRRLRRVLLCISAALLISLAVTIGRSMAITTPGATTTTGKSGGNEASVHLCAASNVRLIDRGTDVGGGSWIQLFQL